MDRSEMRTPIETRAEFVAVLNKLADDYHKDPTKYEPVSVEDLLVRMAHYVNRPLQQSMANVAPDEDPDEPTWDRFESIVMGAMYYTG